MSRSPSSAAPARAAYRERRRGTLWPALLFGLPVSAAVLYYVLKVMPHETDTQRLIHRYFSHWVEHIEVVLFCCGLGALLAKFWSTLGEKSACRTEMLPAWNGEPVPVSEADRLLGRLDKLPRSRQRSWLGCRLANALEFLRHRGSADNLDDQLRSLADNDALAQENSYGLIRFICWAIPILGFLGTVLGITDAVAGVNPETLEKQLNQVTDGLATAFDTTALALILTMVLMFISYIVERGEQDVLERVDRLAEQELAHRFERGGPEQNHLVELVRQNSQVVLQTVEQLVERQAAVWAKSMHEVERGRAEVEQRHQHRLTTALEGVLDKTVETHARRLVGLEKQTVEQSGQLVERLATLATAVRDTNREQQAALTKLTQGLAAQTESLARLQDGEQQLLRLQESLNHNLNVLAGSGAFEQAVESLTAAIHLMTARASSQAGPRIVPKGGAAA